MSRAKMSTSCFPPGADLGGRTEFERFDNIMKRILSVPKTEIDRRIAQERQHRKKRKKRP
jgi:hypothetical protein